MTCRPETTPRTSDTPDASTWHELKDACHPWRVERDRLAIIDDRKRLGRHDRFSWSNDKKQQYRSVTSVIRVEQRWHDAWQHWHDDLDWHARLVDRKRQVKYIISVTRRPETTYQTRDIRGAMTGNVYHANWKCTTDRWHSWHDGKRCQTRDIIHATTAKTTYQTGDIRFATTGNCTSQTRDSSDPIARHDMLDASHQWRHYRKRITLIGNDSSDTMTGDDTPGSWYPSCNDRKRQVRHKRLSLCNNRKRQTVDIRDTMRAILDTITSTDLPYSPTGNDMSGSRHPWREVSAMQRP